MFPQVSRHKLQFSQQVVLRNEMFKELNVTARVKGTEEGEDMLKLEAGDIKAVTPTATPGPGPGEVRDRSTEEGETMKP